ncbi:MAG: transketolase [Propionibacteriaceae bacterium]|jgi:transketolase|nr:transketolase [Propionibacteriaceae bacterium]
MADEQTVSRLAKAALEIRLNLLKLCNQTGIHIGGDMSVADLMTGLWQYQLKYRPQEPKWDLRDRFVLSKGHAAAVTSFNQAAIGCYDPEEIYSEYATDFGRFGMHSCNLINPHVEVSTGSLGHGFPVSTGIAQALKAKRNGVSRVYTVVGDGELQEGSMWESAMLSTQYKLGNLVVVVDRNGLTFDGRTEELMSLEPLADKWRAFNWNVVEIDGHDMAAILAAFDALPEPDSAIPTVIIAATVKGHGISYMENNVSWHAGKLSNDDYTKAVAELVAAHEEKWGQS